MLLGFFPERERERERDMHIRKKRKLPSETPPKSQTSIPISDPSSSYPRPSTQECRAVRDSLLNFHGFPPQFAKYRKKSDRDSVKLEPSDGKTDPQMMSLENHNDSVLDGLVSTLLSQNTTDANSSRAFASLKATFPTWEEVLAADSKCVENAIKCGGLAVTKASCIKNILRSLLEKRGKICLEYLRGLSVDEIKAELRGFKGIGPKTVACVLMFHLQQDDFPVDTHVFRITKAIGWLPVGADREKAYLHLNKQIPNELKFDLNCLLVTHGKLCHRCTGKGSTRTIGASLDPCPLTEYYCSIE